MLLGDLRRIDVRLGKVLPDVGNKSGPILGLDQILTAADRKPIPQLAKAILIDLAEVNPSPPAGALVARVELEQDDRIVSTAESGPVRGQRPRGHRQCRTSRRAKRLADADPAGDGDQHVLPPPDGLPFPTVVRTPVTGPTPDDTVVSVGGPLRTSGVPRYMARDLAPAHSAVIPEAVVVKESPTQLKPAPVFVKVPSNGAHMYSMGFSPDGKTLAVGGDDDLIRLLDADNGNEIGRIKQDSWVQGITFSADGKTIITASFDSRINLWNLATRERSHPVRDESFKTDYVSATTDGKRALALYRDDGDQGQAWTAKLWDLTRGEVLLSMPIRAERVSVDPSPDGSFFLVASSRPGKEGAGRPFAWSTRPKARLSGRSRAPSPRACMGRDSAPMAKPSDSPVQTTSSRSVR